MNMAKTIRSVAVYFAVMIFFIMSLVGWFSGRSPATCCNRALAGAILTYVAVFWAGTIIYRTILDAMISSRLRKGSAAEGK
jgi:hypothetical protein